MFCSSDPFCRRQDPVGIDLVLESGHEGSPGRLGVLWAVGEDSAIGLQAWQYPILPAILTAGRSGIMCARHVPGIVKPGDCVAVVGVEVGGAEDLEGPGPRELEGIVP